MIRNIIAIFIVLNFNQVSADAVCNDGWKSTSEGSGTCSHHKGVRTWYADGAFSNNEYTYSGGGGSSISSEGALAAVAVVGLIIATPIIIDALEDENGEITSDSLGESGKTIVTTAGKGVILTGTLAMDAVEVGSELTYNAAVAATSVAAHILSGAIDFVTFGTTNVYDYVSDIGIWENGKTEIDLDNSFTSKVFSD